MDATRFDTWTRSLVTTRSRRTALRLLATGAAGGLLALLGDREAAADCKKLGKGCAPPLVRCCGAARCRDGRCVAHCPKARRCSNDECCGPCDKCDTTGLLGCTPKPKPTCTNCEEPTCHPDSSEFICFPTCEASQECCGNQCIATCDAGKCETCDEASKSCKSKCASGEACCDGACVNIQTDDKNCGECGRICGDGKACVNSSCQCPGGGAYCQDGCCPIGYQCTQPGSCCTPGWEDCICPSGYGCVQSGICVRC